MQNQGATLSAMKNSALDLLEESGAEVNRSTLLRTITNVKNKAFPKAVGKSAKATIKDLDDLYNDIKSQYPKKISGRETRFILDRIYADVKWDQLAGQRNADVDRLLKDIAKSTAKSLRADAPKYADAMEELAERTQSLSEMSKIFGTPEKAVSALNGMLGQGKQVRRDALERFSTLTGEDFAARFNELVKIKDQLIRSKDQDISKEILPGLYNQAEELRLKATRAKETLDSLSKINPNSSQAAIRNMGYKQPNIETRKAFERLEELTGNPILQNINDRNIADAFTKEYVQGSRKTNLMSIVLGSLGSAAGLYVGGPIGLAAGAIAGATLDNYGGRILKSLTDRYPSVAGLLFVEKGMKKTADEIDRLPRILSSLSEGVKQTGKRTIAIDAIYRLTDSPKDKNVSEQLEDIGDKINTWLADPAMFNDMIGKFTTPLAEGGAPNISESLTVSAQKSLMYLQEKLPKPPKPSSPFAKKIAWNPSDAELQDFAMVLEVAENPFIVLDKLENGELTNVHVEALQRLFPAVYDRLQQKIIEIATQDPKPLDYNQRIKLSMLAGVDLDDSLSDSQFLTLQQRFMQKDEGGQEEPGFAPSQDVTVAKSNLTTLQAATMQ